MPKITHVAHAQQRYETKPVLDENGQPKVTPVMRNGVQRTTKHGKPVTRAVTEPDLTKPLPLYVCGACKGTIEVGQAYKWMEPKTSAYGGRKLTRHEDCPSWHEWEYSSSLSARVAQIVWENTANLTGDTQEEYQEAATAAAEAIRELAQEKQEAADNIESGFEHSTAQSEELAEQATALEQWADEVEQVEIPDLPEPEEEDCEPTEEQMDLWRDEALDAVTSALDECPV